ncbi:hypothetical protein LNTAR_16378 [Lentisphaera araneosa HTCC2155]|uniref:DUF2787 domain-containing protein n=1 Tax=Lentisphaera araneosa HTCC2155 TaxID=313628 RepID=A6DQ90_9BACT|nr:DUF2787 family protein [Lentisphaera araneosa]EDM26141.1 hypothetical protein LNTAR_16378 [Lentisphaera araneosa HTCC2155]
MNIQNLLLPMNKKLNEILAAIIIDNDLGRTAFTLNFRDPSYSADSGGFHTVELRVNEQELIQYITDFAYVGHGPYAELVKEIDFGFQHKRFTHIGRNYPIAHGAELFKIWQKNFVAYYNMGIYDLEVNSS